jgi:hypothetical protein
MPLGYRDDILAALKGLGGEAHRMRVIAEALRIRKGLGANTPTTFEQTVQQVFERHYINSDIFCGKPNLGLFHWTHRRGDGAWAIAANVAQRYERERDGH